MDGSGSVDLTAALTAIGVPDRVETPLGAFEFFDGVPLPESTRKLYDGLDFVRGIDAFLNAVPGASLVAMRRGLRSVGVDGLGVLGVTDPRANSGSLFLTPNTATAYGTMFIDLRDGPVVIEPPTNSLCVVDDFWFRYVTDMGIAGPDKGQGGKYLFLPPGYTGDEPDGYYICRTPTFTNWVVIRALDGIGAVKRSRVYRLSDAGAPPRWPSSTSRSRCSTPSTPTTSPSFTRSTNSSRRSRTVHSTPSGPASSRPSASSTGAPSRPTSASPRSSTRRRGRPRV
ncbi:hypothetical protein BTZ20_4557 [Rhodococcus sp. MTM3W5.2]|nr:hypothetical protein BTZ20_4557 [Rhodococcus sp. MTM3W5.2]